jgi:hypothetical protein
MCINRSDVERLFSIWLTSDSGIATESGHLEKQIQEVERGFKTLLSKT